MAFRRPNLGGGVLLQIPFFCVNFLVLFRRKKYFPKYDNRNIYWIESCSANNNQESIMMLNSQNEVKNLTGKKYNVRSKVHEYGGIAYAVDNDRVFFINHTDQNIYLIEDEKNVF